MNPSTRYQLAAHGLLFSILIFLVTQIVLPAQADVQSITVSGELKVFDGDTLKIGPLIVRLHGIDAPENGQTCASRNGGDWRCGTAAARRLAELIEGKEIDCEALDRDPYGRIIARCRVDGLDLAEVLVRDGLAWAFREFSEDYILLEDESRLRSIGIWQALSAPPWVHRDDKWNRAVLDAPNGCPIKGNISSGKERRKIYHTPWSPNYSTTRIDTQQGERWFCNEGQALAAGWSPRGSR